MTAGSERAGRRLFGSVGRLADAYAAMPGGGADGRPFGEATRRHGAGAAAAPVPGRARR